MAEAFETRTSKNFINRLRTSKRIGNSSLFRLALACALLALLSLLGAAGLSLSLLLFGLSWWGRLLVVASPFGVGACSLARFLLVPPLPFPLGCLLVSSGPVCCLLVPPSGYLVVSATVRLPYLWHGVSWVIGSCLHSASWQQRLRPCVGLCPLHHVVGAVHVPLALALRYSPSGDPEYP